ncbi:MULTISPECIES: CYTH domain-containing protein [Bacillus]|uniref:CYTH domain-containing protein n=1 Tax=Bacillus TaxID=1386 RepID=UPI00065DD1A3|nr:CYTH domain-containing protein [Bacillus smithii]AKP46424.1 Adenylate cyclase [Bacillus smithii]MED1421394.1 CYTH domain-containing protein [Bacillus smithii]MED1457627.1 CYTH domain-containing protein [Bacillus smithii]MED4884947.1 CYTH domain-containing protein [Bacillus smithii]MED4926421.1 CYTH domain-containing protein [Bacillus smithii]
MPKQLEIEFKNLLTEEEFHRLADRFRVSQNDFFSHKNHYFDTPSFLLKEKKMALRIRETNNHFELTLKQPYEKGLLETNQTLNSEEATMMLTSGMIPDGEVKSALIQSSVPLSELKCFGTLTTCRAEIPYKDGILVLDKSWYLNTQDFELEYEVENYDVGKEKFLSLLQQYGIPVRKTENKIKRFYNALMSK